MLESFRKFFPGLCLVTFVACAAKILSPTLPGLGAATLAVLLGMMVRFVLPDNGMWKYGVRWVEKKVLGVAVALLGFGLDVEFLVNMGQGALAVLSLSVIATLLLGLVIIRVIRVNWHCGFLIAIGNAFCGASAIVASAGVLKSDSKDIALSVGVISLLGTAGIFFMPPLVHFLDLSVRDAALLSGGGLQAIGHVAAVGHSLGEEIAELAMAFKMFRIILLIPFLMILGLWGGSSKRAVMPPYYVFGFALAILMRWFELISYELAESIGDVAHMLLVGIMAGLGLGIDLPSLMRQGSKIIVMGVMSFMSLLGVVYGLSQVF
ncbi:MAG: YeiH family protein [Oligoflexales bacterium]